MTKSVSIASRKIGSNFPPYVIAELSGNHNGDLSRALQTIQMAADCGADAVKIQSYTADTMTIPCDKPEFKINGGLWDGYTLYDLYKWAHTPFEWHDALFEKAKACGITLFSSPFDETAVDLLSKLDAPAYKIASFELTDIPLIEYVAKQAKPMIMSTGMADANEIQEAVCAARRCGCDDIVLLHCISAYPAPVAQANLNTIKALAEKYQCVVGLSDHTMGTLVPVAAVASGATVIEKHVTLSRKDKGPDSAFSLEPNELENLCKDARSAWDAMGKAAYSCREAERQNTAYRRSLYFVAPVKSGEQISKEHVRRIRPGFGLPPKYYDQVIGMYASQDIEMGTAVSWDLLNESVPTTVERIQEGD